MGRHLLLSHRKQKWGARTILVSLYTCILGAICFGLYQVPVEADRRGHHPKEVWPIHSYHLLGPVLVIIGYVILGIGIAALALVVLPNLHKAAEWD